MLCFATASVEVMRLRWTTSSRGLTVSPQMSSCSYQASQMGSDVHTCAVLLLITLSCLLSGVYGSSCALCLSSPSYVYAFSSLCGCPCWTELVPLAQRCQQLSRKPLPLSTGHYNHRQHHFQGGVMTIILHLPAKHMIVVNTLMHTVLAQHIQACEIQSSG